MIDALIKAGYSVWWDGILAPGERFANSTQAALESARAVVVLWSATSVTSHWVHDEATRGRDRGVLVPLSLDGSPPPLGFGQFQTYQAGSRRMAGDTGIEAMLEAVAALHDGPPPARAAATAAPPAPRFRRRAVLAGGAITVAALAGGTAWKLGLLGSNMGNSVAVLPFTNLGRDQDDAYFSDGLATEIRSQLAAEPLLAVAAQTSSNKFRETRLDATDISTKLRVAFLLEGSVRRDRDRVRITADLLDGRNGLSRWSQTFDRALNDVFAVQQEIAGAVLEALAAQLASGGVKSKSRVPGGTTSFAAFDAYLKGIDQYERASDRSGDELALANFDKAIAIDPGYAMARAARARSLTVFGNLYDHGPARRARYDEAIAEARREGLDEGGLGAGILRRHELRRLRRELGVGERATVRMLHGAGERGERRGFGVPFRRCSKHEQAARLGADLAQIAPAFRDRRAAARALRAVLPRDTRFLGDRDQPERQFLDAHARPVGVELFRHEHRQRGLHALAHLGLARADHDRAVGLDAHEHAELGRCLGGVTRAVGRERAAAQQQAAGGARADREECAARQLRAHDSSFSAAAARLIALRMRG